METMETIVNVISNPLTLLITGFVIVLGFLASAYDIKFDEGDEEN